MKSCGMRTAGIAVVVGLALSGCGDLRNLQDRLEDGDNPNPPPGTGVNLSDLATQAQNALSSERLSGSQTGQAALQGVLDANAAALADTSGRSQTATYNGGFAAQIAERVDGQDSWITGNTRIDADFANARVTAVEATNIDMHLFDEHDVYGGAIRLGGSLTGAGGAISSGQFSSDIGGTLTNPDHDVTVSGRMDGEFRGQDGSLVAGSFTVNASGQPTPDESGTYPPYNYQYNGVFAGSEAVP